MNLQSRWMHIQKDGQRTQLAHIEHHYITRNAEQREADAMIAAVLGRDYTPAPDPDPDLLALRDLDHARAMARAKAAARPTWEQEKRWFKERLERQRYAAAIGEVCV